MKSIIILFFVCYASSILAFKKSNCDSNMIVMTYNIRYAGDEKIDGINAWSKRKQMVASMIRFHHADLIGVQEALINQLNDLTELLPEYKWIGVGRDDGKMAGEFSAILYKKDRFELLEDSTFWLSPTPNVPSKGWDAALPRISTWGKFKDKNSGKTFYYFNTHFDHMGELARVNSAKLLHNKAAELMNFPIIISGDFNAVPHSQPYQTMTDTSKMNQIFYDSRAISKFGVYGSNISFNDFGKNVKPGYIIDYIFVNNKIDVYLHGIVGDTFYGHYPSDHMPVISEIRIK